MEEVTNVIEEKVQEEIAKQVGPRNRAERRAAAKRDRQKLKKKKYFIDSLTDHAKRLAYVDMIQKLREINKENEEYGMQSTEGSNE